MGFLQNMETTVRQHRPCHIGNYYINNEMGLSDLNSEEEINKVISFIQLQKSNKIFAEDFLKSILEAFNLSTDFYSSNFNKNNAFNEILKRLDSLKQLEHCYRDYTDLKHDNDLLKTQKEELQNKFDCLHTKLINQDAAHQECTENLVNCIEDLANQ